MLLRKFQQLAQWVGFLAIAGLALYGFMSLGSGRLWAAGDESRRAETDAPAITIPSSFNYQGFLRDGNGNPMNGTHKIKISLWTDVQTGSELYFEEFASVAVRDGLFNVVMGSTKTMSPSYFQNVAPLFVGITVDDAAQELLPRQRIHPVPWALLSTSAQEATTLVNGASVSNVDLNGTTGLGDSILFPRGDGGVEFQGENFMDAKDGAARFFVNSGGATIYKDASVNGNLSVGGAITTNGFAPILLKRYQKELINNTMVDTGIPASRYTCTVAGWREYMDINEIGSAEWIRMTYVNSAGNWELWFYSKVHGSTPNPEIWADVLCFHNNLVNVQYVSASVQGAAIPLPATASELDQ